MDWDDLRYVLAIAREGGLNAAARKLEVNPSSVYRRLEALEASLEVRLFERLRSGYRLTAEGESLAEAAGHMETEALDAERRVRGTDTRLAGHIRISTSEGLATFLLPPHLAAFRDAYPDVTLEIGTTNQLVDLSRRDADVAIRATSKPPEHLVGRQTAGIAFAAYASRGYLDIKGRARPLPEYEWIGYAGSLSRVPQAVWLEQQINQSRIHLRFDNFSAIREAAGSGLGCATLPCFVGDGDTRLERLPDTRVSTDLQIWVLTHPDLRRSARIRTFLRFFAARLIAVSALLTGEAPGKKTSA
jgi:DNA-binding transcriptional LysR family regulator